MRCYTTIAINFANGEPLTDVARCRERIMKCQDQVLVLPNWLSACKIHLFNPCIYTQKSNGIFQQVSSGQLTFDMDTYHNVYVLLIEPPQITKSQLDTLLPWREGCQHTVLHWLALSTNFHVPTLQLEHASRYHQAHHGHNYIPWYAQDLLGSTTWAPLQNHHNPSPQPGTLRPGTATYLMSIMMNKNFVLAKCWVASWDLFFREIDSTYTYYYYYFQERTYEKRSICFIVWDTKIRSTVLSVSWHNDAIKFLFVNILILLVLLQWWSAFSWLQTLTLRRDT